MTRIETIREENGRRRVQTLNDMASETQQNQADQADIKKILQRYAAAGVPVNMANVDLQFRDVTEFQDFSDLMEASRLAKESFMRLPSKVREVFDHDVSKWLDAAHDPEKLDELAPRLRKLGVLEEIDPTPRPEPTPDPPASD